MHGLESKEASRKARSVSAGRVRCCTQARLFSGVAAPEQKASIPSGSLFEKFGCMKRRLQICSQFCTAFSQRKLWEGAGGLRLGHGWLFAAHVRRDRAVRVL